MGRVVLGAVVGGIVVFIWGAIAHMALPIGHMGIHPLPKEDAVLGAVRETVKEPGLYFFPGRDMDRAMSKSEEDEWLAKLRSGPTGLMVVTPGGGEPMSPGQLGRELVTDIVGALLAALVLTQVRSGFKGRVLVVTLMGIFGFVSISVPYWNWYHFPLDFTTAEAIDQVVGWTLAGLVLAVLVRPWCPSKAENGVKDALA